MRGSGAGELRVAREARGGSHGGELFDECLRFAQAAGDAEGVVLKGQLQVGDEVALGDSPEAVAVVFVRGGANGDRHQTPGRIDDFEGIDDGQADTGCVDNESALTHRGQLAADAVTCSAMVV